MEHSPNQSACLLIALRGAPLISRLGSKNASRNPSKKARRKHAQVVRPWKTFRHQNRFIQFGILTEQRYGLTKSFITIVSSLNLYAPIVQMLSTRIELMDVHIEKIDLQFI